MAVEDLGRFDAGFLARLIRRVRLEDFWSEADLGTHDSLRTSPSYGGSLKRFMEDCDEFRRQEERVVIISLQEQRLAELLSESGIPVTGQDLRAALDGRARHGQQDHALELGRQAWHAGEILGFEERSDLDRIDEGAGGCAPAGETEGDHAERRQDGARQ